MKKYYQAALTLTAALSLIALLFYRHEYNKLRFVLQVFNYFGTPTLKDDYNCTTPATMWNKYYSEFSSPESTWQRLSDNMHIYSAYNIDNGEIRAIGFGNNIDALKYSCHVFFDNDVESVLGEFSYETIKYDSDESAKEDGTKYNVYLLHCKFNEISKKVVGVQFQNALQKKVNSISIVQVYTFNPDVNIHNNVICVAPPTAGLLQHVNIISFLAFHHHIGWNNFIVYDFGVSHILSKSLKNFGQVSNAQWNFTYTTIPWNFPYAQISHSTIRKIIETDCIYRTYNRATMAVTLSWNEYINLKYHNTVENVLSDIAHENDEMVINEFRLNTLVYCMKNVKDDLLISIPEMLKTTRSLRKIIDNAPHYIYKLANIFNSSVQRDVGNLIFINRYQQCYVEDRREIIDNGMLKFAEYMPNSKIFQYYIAGKLIGH